MAYPNITYHRGRHYSYFEIELDENVTMKFGSIYPHYSSETWTSLYNSNLNQTSNLTLTFKSWTLKAIDKFIFFSTPHFEIKLDRQVCKSAFEVASKDKYYFSSSCDCHPPF